MDLHLQDHHPLRHLERLALLDVFVVRQRWVLPGLRSLRSRCLLEITLQFLQQSLQPASLPLGPVSLR